MRYVGVDLAWGTRRPTGLAVLDTQGRLLHLSTMRTDEEILGALAPYVDGDCLVALDAPLIVTNPTGNRSSAQFMVPIAAGFARQMQFGFRFRF